MSMASHTLLAGDDVDNFDDYVEEGSFSIAKGLTLFFGLALVCGVLFAIGYNMGKSAGLSQSSAALPATSNTVPTAAVKPDAAQPEVKEFEAPVVTDASAATTAAPAEAAKIEEPAPQLAKAPAVSKAPKASAKTAPAKMATGMAVQVAAVRHEEDAQALVAALQRKNYPVYLANGANDPLFHVQVGPFSDVKEADAAKARLVADGYNAIVKK
jgi:DedD protein